MYKKTKLCLLTGLTLLVLLSTASVMAVGRIDSFRDEFRDDPHPILPSYVSGVIEEDLYLSPSPDVLFSWTRDNEAWTAVLLSQLRESSIEIDEKINKWLGSKVLIVLIDFNTYNAYASTFSLETGAVVAEYEDTKTEIWASLAFIQDFLVFGKDHLENETIQYLTDAYYTDWGAWTEIGIGRAVFDVMISRPVLIGLFAWSTFVGGGYLLISKKKS